MEEIVEMDKVEEMEEVLRERVIGLGQLTNMEAMEEMVETLIKEQKVALQKFINQLKAMRNLNYRNRKEKMGNQEKEGKVGSIIIATIDVGIMELMVSFKMAKNKIKKK